MIWPFTLATTRSMISAPPGAGARSEARKEEKDARAASWFTLARARTSATKARSASARFSRARRSRIRSRASSRLRSRAGWRDSTLRT